MARRCFFSDELIGLLGHSAHLTTTEGANPELTTSHKKEEKIAVSDPLVADVANSWNGNSLPDDFFGEVLMPTVSAALLKKLGNFPFWRGEMRLLDDLDPIYTQTSSLGLNVFLGKSTWQKY